MVQGTSFLQQEVICPMLKKEQDWYVQWKPELRPPQNTEEAPYLKSRDSRVGW